MSPELEAQLEEWRARLSELAEVFTHPSQHVGFWIAVLVALAFVMVAVRAGKG